jgi:acyl-CoA synthetase (AMP-forming)/AMP-acid ligase II
MLPTEGEVHTPYGASEALPVTSIGSHDILSVTREQTARGAGTCVGQPLAGIDVKIIKIDDGPIVEWSDELLVAPAHIGEIVVRGPVVTREYFENPQANALAKIRAGDKFWHRMGDVGYLDQTGRLWFCGRKAHRVVTEQDTLFPVPCEAIFNQHPQVRRTALVGVGVSGRQQPVLCVELEQDARGGDSLTKELLALGAAHDLTNTIKVVLYHPSFPVDVRHNAKISREKLAVWAAERLS